MVVEVDAPGATTTGAGSAAGPDESVRPARPSATNALAAAAALATALALASAAALAADGESGIPGSRQLPQRGSGQIILNASLRRFELE